MSLELSSLAVDDIEEQLFGRQAVQFAPDLYVVTPRHLSRGTSLETKDEVVFVGGKFTVSF